MQDSLPAGDLRLGRSGLSPAGCSPKFQVATSISDWCRRHRHEDVETQQRALARQLSGHYGYFGVTSNYRSLARLAHEVKRIWRKWLSRRSQKAALTWEAMSRLLERHPLPKPRIVHPRLT